jgi:hypothetical protein
VATLLPGVLGAVDPDGGQVLVTDPYHGAAYYSRAVVLELERAGVDARVAPERGVLFGQRRVVDEDELVQAELVVVQDRGVDVFTENPDMRLVAKWEWSGAAVLRRNAQRRADHLAELEGQPDAPTGRELLADLRRLDSPVTHNDAKADQVAVFLALT